MSAMFLLIEATDCSPFVSIVSLFLAAEVAIRAAGTDVICRKNGSEYCSPVLPIDKPDTVFQSALHRSPLLL